MGVRRKFRELVALKKALQFANTELAKVDGEEAFQIFQPLGLKERPFLYLPNDDWHELRRWLDLVHKHHGEAPQSVRSEVRERLIKLQRDREIELLMVPGGVDVDVRTPQACCAYALWLLIRDDGGWSKRLVCCEQCGRFDLNAIGRGRPRRNYCNNQHGKRLSVWKATHKNKDEVRKRRRPAGTWQHPYPRRGPVLKVRLTSRSSAQ